jgi:hypothetical protein
MLPKKVDKENGEVNTAAINKSIEESLLNVTNQVNLNDSNNEMFLV